MENHRQPRDVLQTSSASKTLSIPRLAQKSGGTATMPPLVLCSVRWNHILLQSPEHAMQLLWVHRCVSSPVVIRYIAGNTRSRSRSTSKLDLGFAGNGPKGCYIIHHHGPTSLSGRGNVATLVFPTLCMPAVSRFYTSIEILFGENPPICIFRISKPSEIGESTSRYARNIATPLTR